MAYFTEKDELHDKKNGEVFDSTSDRNSDLAAAEKHIRDETGFTPAEFKRLRRKIDMILLPCLMLTYGIQYADKLSLSSSVIFGLREDTHLVGNQYAALTALFYLGYGAAQIPLGWVIQRFPIGRALALMVILWGSMVMVLGACNNYAQLAAVRTFVGVFESVVIPGFAFLTASWYLRSEQTLRQCCYFSMNQVFAMVTSVCIYYLAKHAEEHGGIAAWRIINIFLGALTVFLGIIDLIFLGTPRDVWWLSAREKDMAYARIVSNATGGGEQHPWKWYQVRECFRDPQYWIFALFQVLVCIPNGASMTFTTLIYVSFGFTPFETIIYMLPSSAVALVFVIGPAVCVHFYPHTRFPWAIFCTVLCCACFLYTGLAPDSTPLWTKWAVFLFSMVFATAMFLLWPLMSINVAGRTKKAWLSATSLMTYCVGNIVGSLIFVPSDAPRYLKGLTACAIIMMANCVLMCTWWWYYARVNRKRERDFLASGMSLEERDYQLKLAGEQDMTDIENVHFRYTF